MSAEDLGTRELGQVRSQRLDELRNRFHFRDPLSLTSQKLLTTLRLLHDPSSNSKIGIPALDKLLATHTTRFDPTNLSAIPTPPIIEITSPVPKSGKTELLYWVIANLVLGPDQAQGVEADHADESEEDGARTTPDHVRDDDTPAAEAQQIRNESEAAFADVTADQTPDQREQASRNPASQQTNFFKNNNRTTTLKAVALLSTSPVNISRLTQILLQHLLTTTPNLCLTDARPIISTALSHIHIYQPTSLSSLVATLSSLPCYFLSATNNSKDRRLGGIAICTPSSYLWQDKLASSTSATSASVSTKTKFPALATTLKRVSIQLQTPVLYTTSHFSSHRNDDDDDPGTFQPALPSPFPVLPGLRLVVSRIGVKGFEKEIGAETAARQSRARETAVASKGFRVQINRWGDQGRQAGIGDTGFEVKIDDKGVRII